MSRRSRRKKQPGMPPGALVLTGDALPPRIHGIRYTADGLEERDLSSARDCVSFIAGEGVSWVDIQGLGDLDLLGQLGESFGLHPLALEDVVSLRQRPKVDDYDSHLYIIARMPIGGEVVRSEQVSIFVGPNFVLTFQEHYGDCLDPVRERLRKGKGLMRRSGSDYLAYALIDAIIDSFFPVLEVYGEKLEDLEDELVENPGRASLEKIYDAKRDLLVLRRAIWPMRDAVNSLVREESDLVGAQTRIYLRDCYDHSVQILDMVETYRELAAGFVDIYISSLSQKLNEVMKVLTIIATIFIPLTFVTGIYGMNVPIPGQGWKPLFAVIMLVMAGAGVGMLWYFRRKGWMGGANEPLAPPPSDPKGSR